MIQPSVKKIAGIVLAAGTGSRMGRTKQLLPFASTTLLGRVLAHAKASNLNDVIVVLGYDAEKIQQKIDFSGITIVKNPEFSKGQSTSLRTGIQSVPGCCEGAMFLLGDQPLIGPAIINQLISAWQASPKPILVPYHQQQRGNPVIVHKDFFHHLMQIQGDTGARILFERFKDQILSVQVDDPAIFMDVDRPEDYDGLLNQAGLNSSDQQP